MIEINLIPDIKQEYINAQQMRNKVISISILTMLGAGGLLVALSVLWGVQGVREVLADRSIKSEFDTLRSFDNIDNLITIQNQLDNVSSLNDNKVVGSRLFSVLSAINPTPPNDIKIATAIFTPGKKSIVIEGTAANGFNATDIVKKTILNTNVKYTKNNASQNIRLTNAVEMSDTVYGEDTNGNRILRFKLSFEFPADLFSNASSNVVIVSPTGTIDVTDSKLHVPDSLFQADTSRNGERN